MVVAEVEAALRRLRAALPPELYDKALEALADSGDERED
jgi:hypothetical protein